ncbi:hypothetical protein BDZ85DRAFT_256206 [Elsinoe ampelina]|uniref:Cora-like Mg2+ transporter protein-domain-containing protein n=1 Tax=Elsinoe ampelina TaxID=302913 RepID=A0A6A6GL17_9PEZI|nr:hypothetical protein BDZ85DRAFT_256206 [Elsinoe ampelina]
MQRDPWYALADVFRFVLGSRNQYLNMLAWQIDEEAKSYQSPSHALENLRYLKQVIGSSAWRGSTLLSVACSADYSSWSEGQSNDRDGASVRHHQLLNDCDDTGYRQHQLLVKDLEHLEQRTLELIHSCEKAISELVNHSVLLATLFIPLTFTCTVFGMNFKELGTGRLSIWVFVVALIIVLGCSSFVYFFGMSAVKRPARYRPFRG